jgi:hypothetical protein
VTPAKKQPATGTGGPIKSEGDLIRKAFADGRKFVVLNGVEFKIRRDDRKGTFTSGKDKAQSEFSESWLVATPVRGSLPVISVELRAGGNLRSKQGTV